MNNLSRKKTNASNVLMGVARLVDLISDERFKLPSERELEAAFIARIREVGSTICPEFAKLGHRIEAHLSGLKPLISVLVRDGKSSESLGECAFTYEWSELPNSLRAELIRKRNASRVVSGGTK